MLLAVTLYIGEGLAARAPESDEIVWRTKHAAHYLGKDGRAYVSMTITDNRGNERRRRFTVLRRDQQSSDELTDAALGGQKYYIYLHQPADVRNTVFMVWTHRNKDDERWLYLPALDLVNRIAAKDKRTSFLGSEFYYEDISGRDIGADVHELLSVSDRYFVLKNTPKQPDLVEFSYSKMWIHRETFIPVRVEFYDKQNRLYRLYEALRVETISDYPTVVKSRMQDLRTQGHTIIEFSRVVYDLGLPEEIFTERYLRNAPRRYLR